MEIPEHLYFTPQHQWVRLEGSRAIIGISDYAQLELGMVLYVELPELHVQVTAGDVVGSIETIEDVHDIRTPLSGTIVEINKELEKEAHRLNDSPYNRGWIYMVELDQPEEIERLWRAAEYRGLG